MSTDSIFSHRLILGGLLMALLMPGCQKPMEETPDLIVLHSGRMRGNAYPLALQHLSPLQHYPYLAGYVKKVRAEAAKTGTPVLLVDLGDSLEGSFASYATGGANMVTLFNELGYDAIILGNLDNRVSPELLTQLQPKVLNPFEDLDGAPATAGSHFAVTLTKNQLPIYLLANFYGNVSPEEFPERFPTRFGNTPLPVRPLRDYSTVLAALGPRHPGSVSLMSWMKFEPEGESTPSFVQELSALGINAVLAQRVYGSHVRDVWSDRALYDWKPPISENILRNNGGFVLARLDLKRDGAGWKVLDQKLLPMTANTAPADEEIVARLAQFTDTIAQSDELLFDLPHPVPEAEILQTYVTALTHVAGTQAVIYSRESIRSPWPAGNLRASDVFNSLPWTNPLIQLALTPQQLEAVRKNPSLRIWMAPLPTEPSADAPVVVTTSQYFATLLATQLQLSPDELKPSAYSSEYDYLVNYLKNPSAGEIPAHLPAGWSGDSFE